MKISARFRYKYFIIEEVPNPNRKTRRYEVFSRSSEETIGLIHWFSRWRQYCFFPYANSVWSRGCLEDIQTFIQILMDERKMTS